MVGHPEVLVQLRPGQFRTPRVSSCTKGNTEGSDLARMWWCDTEYRHSALKFVTPEQRHGGRDVALLARRHATHQRRPVHGIPSADQAKPATGSPRPRRPWRPSGPPGPCRATQSWRRPMSSRRGHAWHPPIPLLPHAGGGVRLVESRNNVREGFNCGSQPSAEHPLHTGAPDGE